MKILSQTQRLVAGCTMRIVRPWFPSWISSAHLISTRPRYTPAGREYSGTPWLELDERGSLWRASKGGGFLSLVGVNREAEVAAKLDTGEWVKWEYRHNDTLGVLWDLLRYRKLIRWKITPKTNVRPLAPADIQTSTTQENV